MMQITQTLFAFPIFHCIMIFIYTHACHCNWLNRSLLKSYYCISWLHDDVHIYMLYITMSDCFLNSEEKKNDLAVKMHRRELFASIIVFC